MLARQPVVGNAAQLLVGVPMGVVGFIVARKQPRNPIGWLLLTVVVGILLGLVAGPYAWLVYRLGYRLPFGPLAAFLETAYFPVLVDRIISRTLAYAIVTGLLVGLYAGLVLLATKVLSFHSTVAVAASTLAAG